MKLLEIYSSATSLEIGKQHLLEKFIPLPDFKYITLHASSGMPAKNYPFYAEVIDLLHPILKKSGVEIIQIGGPEDQPIHNCVHMMGKTSLHQSNYILGRSLLHLCNDTWSQHRAGEIGIPLVALFGPTTVANHSAHSFNQEKTSFIESHRNNKNPSFSPQEHSPSIALIPPEQVVNEVLKHLGAIGQLNRKSLHFGRAYTGTTVEWVPDSPLHPETLKDAPILARFDLRQEEAHLFTTLQHRKLAIITKSELSLNPLAQLRQNVLGMTLIIDKDSRISKEFIKNVKSLGIKCQFITYEDDAEWISAKRLDLFEVAQIHKAKYPTKADLVESINNYTNSIDGEQIINENKALWVRSNKFILSMNKIYVSYFNYLNNIPTDSMENNVMNLIDDPMLFRDLEHFYIFQQYVPQAQ